VIAPAPGGFDPVRLLGAQSVAKCHTFSILWKSLAILGIELSDSKPEKKVSHLSHLSHYLIFAC